MFDTSYLLEHPFRLVLGTLGLILLKGLAAYLSVRLLRFPNKTGLSAAFSLFQVGEFSFILLARTTDTVSNVPGWSDILASWSPLLIDSIVLSMFLTPIVLKNLPTCLNLILQPRHNNLQEADGPVPPPEKKPKVIIAGYGPTAKNLAKALAYQHIPYCIVEMNANTIKRLQSKGIPCIYGDISHPEILIEAGIQCAEVLAITFPDLRAAEVAIHHARQLNPEILCLARSRYQAEVARLLEAGANKVVYEELESSISFIFNILQHLDYPMAEADQLISVIRRNELREEEALPLGSEPLFGRFSILGGTKIEWLELGGDSPILGKTLAEAEIRKETGANIVAIIDSEDGTQRDPDPAFILKPGDVLVAVGNIDQLHKLEAWSS